MDPGHNFARRSLRSMVVLSALLFAPAARAEGAVSITREELIARLEKSPQLEVLRAKLDRARAEVTRAGVIENPSLSLQREEVAGAAENFATVELPLEISGRRGKTVDAAQAQARAIEADVARATTLTELEALSIYDATCASRARVEILTALRAAIALRVEELTKRTDAGDASGFDLGRLELELSAHDELLDRERAEHAALQRALAVLAGEPNARFEPSEPLIATAPPALQTLLENALDRRSDHRAAKLRKESAEHALSAAARGWVPSLTLSGGVKTAEVEDRTKLGYVAGLGIHLPFFDHGRADRERAHAELREASAELRRLELEIPAAIARAHDALELSVAQAKRFETELAPRLDALLRRAETAYREGERPVFELLDAYRTAREHRLRHVDVLLHAKRAELELRRAAGESK